MHNETAVSQPAAMKSQEMHSDGDTKMPEQQDEKEEAEAEEEEDNVEVDEDGGLHSWITILVRGPLTDWANVRADQFGPFEATLEAVKEAL